MIFSMGDISRNEITIRGEQFRVYTSYDWIFKYEDIPVAQVFLIGDKLLLLQVRGMLTPEIVKKIGRSILKKTDQVSGKLSLISRIEAPFMPRDIRKLIFKEEEKLRNKLDKYYFVAKGRARSILNVYKSLHSVFSHKLYVVETVNEAIMHFFEKGVDEKKGISDRLPVVPDYSNFPVDLVYEEFLLKIDHQKEWSIDREEFQFSAYTINKKVFVYRLKGKVDIPELLEVNSIGKRVLKSMNPRQVIIVSDLYGLTSISKKARILLEKIFKDSEKRKLIEYTCPNSMMNAVLKVQQVLNPQLTERMLVVRSFKEALKLALQKLNDRAFVQIESIDVHNLPPKQLKSLVSSLIEDIKRIRANRDERISQLMEGISGLTFSQEYQEIKSPVDETDPFYNLFNAFVMLRKDMFQMSKEIKKLREEEDNSGT